MKGWASLFILVDFTYKFIVIYIDDAFKIKIKMYTILLYHWNSSITCLFFILYVNTTDAYQEIGIFILPSATKPVID